MFVFVGGSAWFAMRGRAASSPVDQCWAGGVAWPHLKYTHVYTTCCLPYYLSVLIGRATVNWLSGCHGSYSILYKYDVTIISSWPVHVCNSACICMLLLFLFVLRQIWSRFTHTHTSQTGHVSQAKAHTVRACSFVSNITAGQYLLTSWVTRERADMYSFLR